MYFYSEIFMPESGWYEMLTFTRSCKGIRSLAISERDVRTGCLYILLKIFKNIGSYLNFKVSKLLV